jgi:hypothetical protein
LIYSRNFVSLNIIPNNFILTKSEKMKKILLSMAIACVGFSVSSYAQTIWSDNIATATPPALPTGWTQHSPGVTTTAWFTATSATAGTTWGSLTDAYNIPSHGKFLTVDDNQYPNQPHDTVFSPTFAITGTYANLWLNFDEFFYAAENSSSGISESSYVLGTIDGGTTWTIIDTLQGYAWNYDEFITMHLNLSTLTGSSCKLAFTYSDVGTGTTDGALIGVAVNNINVVNLTADSASVVGMSFNNAQNGICINGTPLGFTVDNLGIPITTFVATYTINGGTPISQTFTPSSAFNPYTAQSFTFTTSMAGMVSTMTNTVTVCVTTVNGSANSGAGECMSTTAVLASTTAQRQCMVEEFTSSTCPPCMEFASSFDPLCTSLNADVPSSNFNIIKYQMNWPDLDNDRSYNSDGAQRRTYYGVDAIPEHFVNGVEDGYNWSYPFSTADDAYFTNEFTVAGIANKSFMEMTATYSVDTIKKKLYTSITVTPYFTKTGTYHVYIAVADKHYENIDNEWGMLDYYNVMRVMFPDGNGNAVTSWTSGVPMTYTDTGVAYTSTNWVPASTDRTDSSLYPVQMSNEFWNNPLTGSELIAFVEEDGTQSIMQSIVADPTNHDHVAGVSVLSKVNDMNIFPNPTSTEATLRFNLDQPGNVNVRIMDYAGHLVSEISNGNMTAGVQNITISTANIADGNYSVVVSTEGGSNAVRLTVAK